MHEPSAAATLAAGPDSMKRRALILGGLSLAGLALAETMKPRELLARSRSGYNYEVLIPQAFGQWQEVPQVQGQIVDPSLADTISRFYTQTVTRAYVDSAQDFLMLSLAYGEVQNDSMRVHLPEVCYVAQGFDVTPLGERTLRVDNLSVPLTTLAATHGGRKEMISYFVKIGEKLVGRGVQRKFAQMEYSLKGIIPDGLLVRVSSFSHDSSDPFALHQRFVAQLFEASTPFGRKAIFGGPTA
jgi:EpsI family protein